MGRQVLLRILRGHWNRTNDRAAWGRRAPGLRNTNSFRALADTGHFETALNLQTRVDLRNQMLPSGSNRNSTVPINTHVVHVFEERARRSMSVRARPRAGRSRASNQFLIARCTEQSRVEMTWKFPRESRDCVSTCRAT